MVSVTAADGCYAICRETQHAPDASELSVLPDTYVHHDSLNTKLMQPLNKKIHVKVKKKTKQTVITITEVRYNNYSKLSKTENKAIKTEQERP